MSSSFVGITQAETLLPSRLMRGPPVSLAATAAQVRTLIHLDATESKQSTHLAKKTGIKEKNRRGRAEDLTVEYDAALFMLGKPLGRRAIPGRRRSWRGFQRVLPR